MLGTVAREELFGRAFPLARTPSIATAACPRICRRLPTSKLEGHSAGEMKMGKQTTDATKAAALYMLKNGLASYKEIAELSGRSRQIIRIWGGRVDAPEARKRYLQRVWTRASRSRR